MLLQSIQSKKNLRDILLSDSEDAEVFYPSKINENQNFNIKVEPKETPSFLLEKPKIEPSPFILANTQETSLHHLKNECIIPVFSKDNEKTIAHQEFIEVVQNTVNKVFAHHSITSPEIRVSHQIKGRIPEAIHKPAKELLDFEKTIYYERMAFILKIPSIKDTINGNELSLTIGGVRSYNQENLYSKKTMEKFKFFIGFQNKVCCNLCVSTDGFLEDLRVSNAQELQEKITQIIQNYNAEQHLKSMKQFVDYELSEQEFAQLLGRARLYQHLPKSEKLGIPALHFNDSQLNTMAKDYYEDPYFSRENEGSINLWKVYNLFTQANKSSYIDTFLDRNLNAFEFSKSIQHSLSDNNYHWFLR